MTTKTAFVLLAALSSAAAIGCGSGGPGNSGTTTTARASLHRAKGCGDLLADLKADAKWKLDHALNNQIAGIRACQSRYPDAQCASYGGYYGGAGGGAVFAEDARATTASPTAPVPAPNAGAAGAPKSSGAEGAGSAQTSDSSSKSSAPSASSYSETNTQVKGVDEADIVKNDGKNIYVLHGRSFKVINAFPATALKEVGSTDVEGNPSEMFVSDGKVVVYSQVNGAAIFSAAGVATRQQYQDYGYGYGYYGGGDVAVAKGAPGGYYPGSYSPGPYIPLTKVTVFNLEGGVKPVVAREIYFEGSYLDARRVNASVRSVFQGFAYGPQLKYSVYDLYPTPVAVPPNAATPARDPAAPGGEPTKSDPVPTPTPPDQPTTPVSDPYPKTGTEMIAALEKLRATNAGIIDASVINDWLPYTFTKQGTAVSAKTTDCQDFYVPTTGSTESGITQVSTFDLNDPGAPQRDTAILGRADTVYASADTMYLATHAWIEPPRAWVDNITASGGGVGGTDGSTGSGTAVSPPPPSTEPSPPPSPTPAPKPGGIQLSPAKLQPKAGPATGTAVVETWSANNTHVHKFEFATDPKIANYVASGTVRGSVKNQFSLDDKDGFLRVATTEDRQYYTTDGGFVSADGAAIQKGAPPPARPARVSHLYVLQQQGAWLDFAGDAGDIAPNEQIMSTRFVDGRGYVVTFRQVDPLFVFDLTNPQQPTLAGELTIPGFSEYMHPLDANHLLTIGRNASSQGRQLGLQLQIFDVTNASAPAVVQRFTYAGDEYGSSDAEYDHKAFTYFADKGLLAFPYFSYGNGKDGAGMHSSLELFRVSVANGIAKLGAVDGTQFAPKPGASYCGGYFEPNVRRGVFLDNTVYAISYGGIVAKDINALGAAGASLALPAPQVNDGYGPVCYPGAGAGGATTEAAPPPVPAK